MQLLKFYSSFEVPNVFSVLMAGTVISFTGGLPVGIINMQVLQFAAIHQLSDAWWLLAGAIVVELLLVSLLVRIMQLVAIPSEWLRILYAAAATFFLLLFVLQVAHVFSASDTQMPQANVLSSSPFFQGVLLNLLNPLPVTFWAAWITVVKSKGLSLSTAIGATSFVLGVGLGSVLSFVPYLFLGSYLMAGIHQFSLLNQLVLAALYLFVASSLTIKFFKVRKLHKKAALTSQ